MGINDDAVFRVVFERKLLGCVTTVVFIGMISWLVAISTNYWVIVVGGMEGIPVHNGSNKLFLWSHSGLWNKCDYYRTILSDYPPYPHQDERICQNFGVVDNDDTSDFVKAEFATCIIVVILIFMATGFSFYSLIHPRYTFKRVAASLHLMTGVVLLVLMEMVETESHLQQHELDPEILKKSQVYFGISYLISWIVFLVFLMASTAFFAGSSKRKTFAFDHECALK